MLAEQAARLRGSEGERRVSERLRKLALTYGFLLLDNVLVTRGGVSAQLDHVVLDRNGLLVIETRARRNSVIKGAEGDNYWTACYASGRRERFPNPLEQSRRHLDVLREALLDQPVDLSADSVTGAIVFAGGRVDGLDLDATTSATVVHMRDLERLFQHRRAHGHRTAILTAEQMVRAFSVLTALDRSHDAHLVARHVAACRAAAAPLAHVG
jgi:hypothetical protein